MSVNFVAILKGFVIALIVVVGLICGAAALIMVTLPMRAEHLMFFGVVAAAIIVALAAKFGPRVRL